MCQFASPGLCQILCCCMRAPLTHARLSVSLCTRYHPSCLAIGRMPIMTGSCFVTIHLHPVRLYPPRGSEAYYTSDRIRFQVKLMANFLHNGTPVARLSVIVVQSRYRSSQLRHGVCKHLVSRKHQTDAHNILEMRNGKSQENQATSLLLLHL